jgi:HD-GYP domain-containing protein (c-di-GMP phosphodiesterase class II)
MLLAEQLVGEGRQRRLRRMSLRERAVNFSSAGLFLVAAGAFAALAPDERAVSPLLVIGLVVGYVMVLRINFEFGALYVSPEQLLFVPIALLCPLPWVPFLVAGAGFLSIVPDAIEGGWARDRWVARVADSWFCLGPAIVLALLAPGKVTLDHAAAYVLALAAFLVVDLGWVALRNALIDRVPVMSALRDWGGTARVDVLLAPVALMFALPAETDPVVLVGLAPLIWMLILFARDRQARYASALELQRAYRGTVTLLADVVECDDPYTAAHSRSIVELSEATAEKLGVPREERQRLEFAALLHDIGKMAIPKNILNKPASLTQAEFDVMKTHTIEGQFMLDRVGGLLGEIGEIIRSCHERWDGTGYPDRLAGQEIPLCARIVFACDAYSAMTTDRVYRGGRSSEAALIELARHAGAQFDPDVVSALVSVIEDGQPEVATAGDEVRAILARDAVPQRVGTAY